MSPHIRIEAMRPEHAHQVPAIYQLGIDEGDATFETHAPTWEKFDTSKLAGHRYVALHDDGRVLGWVAVTPVSDRCAYAGVVGFRAIGTRERIGRHHGRWRDVILIERRSPTVD
jgi:phosphinothricin acetyltransferase